jgi:hypothetical protein
MLNKYFLGAALILSLTAPVFAQDDNDDLSRKLELAKEYSKVVPVEEEINKSIGQLIVNVPVDQRGLFKSILERNIKADRLKAVSELALAETFTIEEIQAMIAYYKSPEGQAVREKMPEYQSKLQPVLEQMVRDSIEAFQNQTR